MYTASRFRRIAVILLALGTLALIGAGCRPAAAPTATPPPAPTATPEEAELEPIKIGLDMPVSGPGGLEGQNVKRGAELAVEEINADGGLLGRMLELVVGDNQCDPAVGMSALRRLIEVDRVAVTMGSTCSSVSLAVLPILEETKTASLDVTATNPDITAQSGPAGGNIWKFRLNINDLLMNEEFAKRVIDKEVDALALMVTNTDYGRGVVDVFKATISDTVVTDEYFNLGEADFRPLLSRINDLDPEGILIIGDFSEASKIIAQMHELGMDQNIYGRGTVVTVENLELVSEEARYLLEGAKEVNFWAPNPDAGDLADRFKAKFGDVLNRDNALGYFGMQVLAEAIRNCGEITGDLAKDRACIRDGLAAVDMDIAGLGHVKFDDYHQAHYDMFISTIENGEVKVTERVPTE